MNQKKKLIYSILILFTITLYNFVFSDYVLWGSLVAYTQILFVIITLFRKNGILKAYKYHFMFIITSFEYPLEIIHGSNQQIYNYRTVEIFGVSISIVVLLLITIKLLVKGLKGTKTSPKWKARLIFPYIALGGIALVVGLLGAINENTFRWVINDLYYFVFILCNVLILFNLNVTEKQFRDIRLIFIAGVLASPFISLMAPFFGVSKMYGGLETLPGIALLFFVPLFSTYSSKLDKNVKSLKIIGILAILIVIFFKPSGKELIIIAFIPLLLLYQYAIHYKIKKIFFFVPIFIIIFVILVSTLPSRLFANQLFSIKFTEALSLLNIFNWIRDPYQLPPSPRFRVIEFLNILKANFENIFFVLFGRGFGGFFSFDYYPLHVIEASAFDLDQLTRGLFYRPHESLNVILLKHGLIGILYWVGVLTYMLKEYKTSFFYIISFIWLFLFYGYSFIYPTIGIVAFFIAEYEKKVLGMKQ